MPAGGHPDHPAAIGDLATIGTELSCEGLGERQYRAGVHGPVRVHYRGVDLERCPVTAAAGVIGDQDVQVPEFGDRGGPDLRRCGGVGEIDTVVHYPWRGGQSAADRVDIVRAPGLFLVVGPPMGQV